VYRALDAPHIRIPHMMILRSSPPSPFGRKVKLALGILGLENEVTIEKADPTDISDSLRQQNPLGKIPALIIEDGSVLYDSPVILEYLDVRAGGGKIIPKDPKARIAVLTLQALCDGILDAGILLVYEGRWRPAEMHVQKWIEHQRGKVERAFAVLEAAPPKLDAVPDVGAITLACALGYGDLRFEGKWRAGHPKLVKWLDEFAAKVPAFENTHVTA
jgi:glutathione S-transferase